MSLLNIISLGIAAGALLLSLVAIWNVVSEDWYCHGCGRFWGLGERTAPKVREWSCSCGSGCRVVRRVVGSTANCERSRRRRMAQPQVSISLRGAR